MLAGGLARRMGGGDKPLRPLAGRPLLAHVLDRLAPQVTRVALNANGPAERFGDFGLPVLADSVPGNPGPLAGVLAGLDWLAAEHPEMPWLVTVAGDAPFLPADVVARLHAARQAAGTAMACAASGGQAHPTQALWPVALREDLRATLARGEYAVGRFAARHGVARAEWAAQPRDPFFNVNTPEDLALAEGFLNP